MSMPQHFYVVVIASDSEIASVVTAIFGGPGYIRGISPHVIAATTSPNCVNREILLSMGHSCGLKIPKESVCYTRISPGCKDLWLALDKTALVVAHEHIRKNGPPRKSFYRSIWPDAVAYAEVNIPPKPTEDDNVASWRNWFALMAGEFKVWEQKLWDAFSDSS